MWTDVDGNEIQLGDRVKALYREYEGIVVDRWVEDLESPDKYWILIRPEPNDVKGFTNTSEYFRILKPRSVMNETQRVD